MLNIIICDDEVNSCELLEKMIRNFGDKANIEMNIEIYYSATSLVQSSNHLEGIDLVFLDIEMEEINGIELGQMIRHEYMNENLKIVYISWKDEYALDLFKIRPFDFLVKPLTNQSVDVTLKTVYDIIQRTNNFLYFQVGRIHHKVAYRDILFIESSNRKIKVHKEEACIEFYGKLEDVLAGLDQRYFWRIHKSYVVNYPKVMRFEYEKVILDNHIELSISQQYRTKIKKLKRQYWGIIR